MGIIIVMPFWGCHIRGNEAPKIRFDNQQKPGEEGHDGGRGNRHGLKKNGGQKSKMSEKTSADTVIDALVGKQRDVFPKIIKELTTDGKKTSHWIWWVFPSEMPGTSEPGTKTYVEPKTAGQLLSKADLKSWVEILSKIDQLLTNALQSPPLASGNKPDKDIIPSIDHGRIKYSLEFWLVTVAQETAKHPEFKNALEALARFDWR